MKITRILCVVACLALGVIAACHAYEPSSTSSCCASCSPAVKPVNDILTKLEALKAKKDAIELEERPLLVALKKEMKAQQERMAKLGIAPEAPAACYPAAPTVAPVKEAAQSSPYGPFPVGAIRYAPAGDTCYDLVTSQRTIRHFDPETQTYKDVTTPRTTYVHRGPSNTAASGPPPAVPSAIRAPFLFDSPYSLTQPK